MTAHQVTVNKNLIALEDILIGFGTVIQTRGNAQVEVTEINASNFPFDEENSLQDIIDFLVIYGDAVQLVADNIDEILGIADDVLEAQILLAQMQIIADDMQDLVDEWAALDIDELFDFKADVLAGNPGESFGIVTGAISWNELIQTPQSLSIDTAIQDNLNGIFFGDLVLEPDVDITFGTNSILRLI